MILIRVDDFPAWTETMDRFVPSADFTEFHRALAGHGLPYLLGVTPQPALRPLDAHNRETRLLAEAERALLEQITQEGVDVALHGATHQTRDPRQHSEFAGMDDIQFQEQVRYGLLELERITGARPRAFIPPFNRVNEAQLGLLAKRFRVICGGPETVKLIGPRGVESLPGGSLYVPSYPPFYGRAHEILPALLQAHQDDTVCVTLHWEWERRTGFRDLEAFCAALEDRAVSWKEILDGPPH